MLPKIL
ncbi:hypothetical protein Bhyg_08378 [Pseudolycoriella hygida]|nr:hypothetical protein Bhyg_08378 [Pseudolycoriella hygida]